MFSHCVVKDLSEQGSGLTEIAVGVVGFVPRNQSGHFVGFVFGFRVESEGILTLVDGVGFVVGKISWVNTQIPPFLSVLMGPSRCPLATLALYGQLMGIRS